MNKKRTNRLVGILNIIAIVSMYVFYFSTNYLSSSFIDDTSIYNSFIIETLLNHGLLIVFLLHGGVGILNIICAIQNKESKKLCFWQLVFGIIWTAIIIEVFLNNHDIMEWRNIIVFGIIPIILAIVNIVLIKKHKPKVIQVISYILVIILAIFELLKISSDYLDYRDFMILDFHWYIIAIVMQFIYIHRQEKYIKESNARKIINIILYYVLQLLLVVVFFFMIIASLLITKVNRDKWKNEIFKLYDKIETLQGATNKELYIPVEKNYKYGFMNESGQEKIACEYDRVSYFNEVQINNTTYYIALAKKDNKFYILSKSNNNIVIGSELEKYLQTIDECYNNQVTRLNENDDDRNAYLQHFEFVLQYFSMPRKIKLNQQIVEKDNDNNNITLSERDSKYYYSNKNYSMLIEPIHDEQEEIDYDSYYENYYDEDESIFYLSLESTKCNVTITKNNGETESSIVYLPRLYEGETTLGTFTNGYIEFENEERTRKGWYDNYGNKTTIPNNYTIEDIKDGKVILQKDNTKDINEKPERHYIMIDMEGKTLLETTALDIYDNIYLVKNHNNKMVLMNKELKEISNEYDKIITTMQMDISPQFSSYY